MNDIKGKQAIINIYRLYDTFGEELKYARVVRQNEPYVLNGRTLGSNNRVEDGERVWYYLFSKDGNTFIAQDGAVATIDRDNDGFVELKPWQYTLKLTREEAVKGLVILM